MIRAVLFILLSLLGFSFIIQNTHQVVTIQYFMDIFTPTLPAYQLVMGAFVMGMLLTSILIFPEWIRLRLELRRLRKSLKLFGKALHNVRPASSERFPATSHKRRESGRVPGNEGEDEI